MVLKPLLYLFFVFILITTGVSAGSVYREIVADGTFFNITLTPDPYEDFTMPGWYVEEAIPAGTQFVETDADNYTINGSVLSLIRFAPSENTSTINYVLGRLDKRDNYRFEGRFKDENKNSGVINIQDIKPDFKGETNTSEGNWGVWPSSTSKPKPNLPSVSRIVSNSLTANQSQPINAIPITTGGFQLPKNIGKYIAIAVSLLGVFAGMVALVYLNKKKKKARKIYILNPALLTEPEKEV